MYCVILVILHNMRLVWLVVEIHKGFKMNWKISVNIEEIGGKERDKLESSVALYYWEKWSSIFTALTRQKYQIQNNT